MKLFDTLKTRLFKHKKKATKKGAQPLKFKGGVYQAIFHFVRHEGISILVLYGLAIAFGIGFPVSAYRAKYAVYQHYQNGSIVGIAYFIVMCVALLFSLPTTIQFGNVAFSGIKAKGFAYALELVMLVPMPYLSPSALVVLCVLNTLASFYNMSSGNSFDVLIEAKKTTKDEKNTDQQKTPLTPIFNT